MVMEQSAELSRARNSAPVLNKDSEKCPACGHEDGRASSCKNAWHRRGPKSRRYTWHELEQRGLASQPLTVIAKPILKWAGGKRELEEVIIKHILKVYPEGFEDYYEPFCGGAAIFFALRSRGLIHGRAQLSDANVELIELYETVRDDVEGVLKELRKLCKKKIPAAVGMEDEIRYYTIRADQPKTPAARAARTLYLNKNGFNGLYRVNKSGGFNVPWGKRKTPYVPAEDEICAASRALQGVDLLAGKFTEFAIGRMFLTRAVRPVRDFCYMDPPYIPASASADFSMYVSDGFELAHEMNREGVPFLLSNSDTKKSRALYKGLTVKTVKVSRKINSVVAGRGKVSELLVSNKGPLDHA